LAPAPIVSAPPLLPPVQAAISAEPNNNVALNLVRRGFFMRSPPVDSQRLPGSPGKRATHVGKFRAQQKRTILYETVRKRLISILMSISSRLIRRECRAAVQSWSRGNAKPS